MRKAVPRYKVAMPYCTPHVRLRPMADGWRVPNTRVSKHRRGLLAPLWIRRGLDDIPLRASKLPIRGFNTLGYIKVVCHQRRYPSTGNFVKPDIFQIDHMTCRHVGQTLIGTMYYGG